MSILITLRSAIAAVIFILITIFWGILGIILNIFFNRRRIDSWIITTWGKQSCGLFGVRIHLHDLDKMTENLPKKQGAIVLFNHTSFIDVIAMAGYLNNVRFGSKIELFSIPIFGQAIRRFGTLPIARNNREEVFKIYDEAKPRFARGERFALSPEGGRFFGPELSKFKSGPFVFAINAQVPLVPVVIHNANTAWSKQSILPNTKAWVTDVNIYILDPIETTGLNVNERDVVIEKAYAVMNACWKKNQSSSLQ